MASTILDAQGKTDEHLVKIAPKKRLAGGSHNLGNKGQTINTVNNPVVYPQFLKVMTSWGSCQKAVNSQSFLNVQ